MEQREYREETKSWEGQRSSAVALTVGAAKARTHSGKQSFYFVLFCFFKREDVYRPLEEEERLDFAVCVTFRNQLLKTLSMSSR